MSIKDVLSTIKTEEINSVDLRFTDTLGKEQHITVSADVVNEEFFKDGKMFDGSSIAGWRTIDKSDMVLMPDPTTVLIDPFYEQKTLSLRCDVYDPETMTGYDRCPRSLAKRVEEYVKSTGIADSCFFGPEPEFFIFDDVRWEVGMQGCFYKIDSEEAAWNSRKNYDGGNPGHRPRVRGAISRFHQ
jgi:glutamine synthetase